MGGLVGHFMQNMSAATLLASVWNKSANPSLKVIGGDSPPPLPTVADVTGTTKTDFANQSVFTNMGWDFANVWCYTDLDGRAMPRHRWLFDRPEPSPS